MDHKTQRISATIPSHLIYFIKDYKETHHLKSTSEVISEGLKTLEKIYLEQCYAEAEREIEEDSETKAEMDLWEQTAGDGLDDDETW